MGAAPKLAIFTDKRKGIKIYIDALIEENTEDLVIAGQDITRSGDYEYWLRVAKEDKKRLLEGLLADGDAGALPMPKAGRDGDLLLLELVQKRFGNNHAVTQLQEWCKGHGIEAKFSSYGTMDLDF